jgi:hypothetical protein
MQDREQPPQGAHAPQTPKHAPKLQLCNQKLQIFIKFDFLFTFSFEPWHPLGIGQSFFCTPTPQVVEHGFQLDQTGAEKSWNVSKIPKESIWMPLLYAEAGSSDLVFGMTDFFSVLGMTSIGFLSEFGGISHFGTECERMQFLLVNVRSLHPKIYQPYANCNF